MFSFLSFHIHFRVVLAVFMLGFFFFPINLGYRSVACRVPHVHLPLVCVEGISFTIRRVTNGGRGEATSQIGFLLSSVIDLSVFMGLHLTGLLLQQCHCFCQFYFFFFSFLFSQLVGTPVRGDFDSGQRRFTHAKRALN